MPDMHITLPPDALAVIQEAVAGGQFSSESEVIAEALRAWKGGRENGLEEDEEYPFTVHTVEELRAKIKEVEDDPGPYLLMDEVFDPLIAEYAALARKQK